MKLLQTGFSLGAITRVSHRIERLSDEWFAYLLLAPMIFILVSVAYWPLLNTLDMSLHAEAIRGGGYVGEFIGLDNFIEVLTGERDLTMPNPFMDFDRPFQSALIVTIILSVFTVSLSLLLGFGEALIMDQEFRGRRWVRLAFLLPWSVPVIIHGMMFFLMFVPGVGFAAPILQDLGILGVAPLNSAADSAFIIIITGIWKTSTFVALLVLAGLQSIDRNLYRVAKVSGASPWDRFKMITFPLLIPTLFVVVLFRSIQALKVYGTIEVVSSCRTLPSLTCLVVSTFSEGSYATASAVAVITSVVIAIIVAIYLVTFARDNTRGAI